MNYYTASQILGRILAALDDEGPQTTTRLLAIAHRFNPTMTKDYLVEFLQDYGDEDLTGERIHFDDEDLTWELV